MPQEKKEKILLKRTNFIINKTNITHINIFDLVSLLLNIRLGIISQIHLKVYS